jgi:HEPN domain-containing protein
MKRGEIKLLDYLERAKGNLKIAKTMIADNPTPDDIDLAAFNCYECARRALKSTINIVNNPDLIATVDINIVLRHVTNTEILKFFEVRAAFLPNLKASSRMVDKPIDDIDLVYELIGFCEELIEICESE